MSLNLKQFNKANKWNVPYKKSAKWAAISMGLLMALGNTITGSRADQTNDFVNANSRTPSMQSDYNDVLNDPAQVTVQQPITDESSQANQNNLMTIDQKSNLLRQDILIQQVNSVYHKPALRLPPPQVATKSFNANRVLDRAKSFHQKTTPQVLKVIPGTNDTHQNVNKLNKMKLFSKLQIMMIIYAVLNNFIKVPNVKEINKKAKHRAKMLTKQPANNLVKPVISFHDVYGDVDGLKVPSSITKIGKFDDMYMITAPDHWIFIDPNGKITNYVMLHYRDGNQVLDVAPIYQGLVYKYNQMTKAIEFTQGTLRYMGSRELAFLNDDVSPNEVSSKDIWAVKFDRGVQFKTTDLSNLFNHDSYLKSIDLRGLNNVKLTSVKDMFANDKVLQLLTLPNKFKLSSEMLGNVKNISCYKQHLTNRDDEHHAINIFDGQSHPGTWLITSKPKISIDIDLDQGSKNHQWNNQSSRQAKENALNELSTMIGSLDSENHNN